MKEIIKEDIEKFEYVIKLTMTKGNDKQIMQYLMTEYVDHKCFICPNCAAQIRHAHNRLINHYQRYNEYLKTLTVSNDNSSEDRLCRNCSKDISSERKTVKYCITCRKK